MNKIISGLVAAALIISGILLLDTPATGYGFIGGLLTVCGVILGFVILGLDKIPVGYQTPRGFHYGIPVRGHSDDEIYKVIAPDGKDLAIFEGTPRGLEQAKEFCQGRDEKLQVQKFPA